MKTNMLIAAGLGAILVSTSAMAHIIGFTDYYAAPAGTYNVNGQTAGNWLLTKSGTANDSTVSFGASTIQLTGSSGGGADTMKFTISPQSFPVGDNGFMFTYQGYAGTSEQIGYIIGGTQYPLLVGGPASVNPTVVVVQPVPAGGDFGFYIVGDGTPHTPGNYTVSDFQTIPEPGQVAAMGVTLVGVASYLIRRRMAKSASK